MPAQFDCKDFCFLPAQFVKGRSIIENFLTLHEMLAYYRRTRKRDILYKLDFEKAFDKVNWQFLLDILNTRGFPPKQVNWIKMLLFSSSIAILVNETICKWIKCKQGLRQGDPLSPAIFILIIGVLSRILKQASKMGLVERISSSPCFIGIQRLHFIDDTLLFYSSCPNSLLAVKAILLAFDKASRLKVNFKQKYASVHEYQ